MIIGIHRDTVDGVVDQPVGGGIHRPGRILQLRHTRKSGKPFHIGAVYSHSRHAVGRQPVFGGIVGERLCPDSCPWHEQGNQADKTNELFHRYCIND